LVLGILVACCCCCGSCFAFFVSGYAFADGVEGVGDAAVLDACLEETHCCVCCSVLEGGYVD